MKELDEIQFDGQRLTLKNNLVRSPILPRLSAEMDRDVQVDGETVVEGALYARNLEVAQGPFTVHGAAFAQGEIHIANDCAGLIEFKKSVGSAAGIVALSPKARILFGADINARKVNLRNAYVAANIFADEAILENCVVLGGVFATRSLELADCVVGTYNSPGVRLARGISLLLPSAFSVEPLACLPGTQVQSLALADLGALMRGVAQAERSGAIPLDPAKEEQRVVLTDAQGEMQVVRCLSVAGKVLAADLLDLEKMQAHFLMAVGSLGSQLLKAYDLGLDAQGRPVELTAQGIADFFFGIVEGKTQPKQLAGDIDIREILEFKGA